MDSQELVCVYTVGDPNLAEIIKNALQSEGIKASIENEGQAGLSGVLDIKICVRAIDADRATKFIKSHQEAEQDED